MPEVELHDGQWTLPDRPGLGVELDPDTVQRALAAPITVVE
jgi:L-alanine-DL-glutamate epimerase-like enolase superfamily enzyme